MTLHTENPSSDAVDRIQGRKLEIDFGIAPRDFVCAYFFVVCGTRDRECAQELDLGLLG